MPSVRNALIRQPLRDAFFQILDIQRLGFPLAASLERRADVFAESFEIALILSKGFHALLGGKIDPGDLDLFGQESLEGYQFALRFGRYPEVLGPGFVRASVAIVLRYVNGDQ